MRNIEKRRLRNSNPYRNPIGKYLFKEKTSGF
jgi:hypothetical protein